MGHPRPQTSGVVLRGLGTARAASSHAFHLNFQLINCYWLDFDFKRRSVVVGELLVDGVAVFMLDLRSRVRGQKLHHDRLVPSGNGTVVGGVGPQRETPVASNLASSIEVMLKRLELDHAGAYRTSVRKQYQASGWVGRDAIGRTTDQQQKAHTRSGEKHDSGALGHRISL